MFDDVVRHVTIILIIQGSSWLTDGHQASVLAAHGDLSHMWDTYWDERGFQRAHQLQVRAVT